MCITGTEPCVDPEYCDEDEDTCVLGDYVRFVQGLGPISFWRLGERSGTTAVDLAGGNDGTYHDVILGRPGAVVGDPDTSVEFTGQPSHVEIPHSDDYLLTSGTVSLCFYDLDDIVFAGLFTKDSSGFDDGGHLAISALQNRRILVRLQSATTSFEVLSEPVNDGNEWIHIVFTFGEGGMRLHIDGTLADSDSYTGGLLGNLEPIALGAATGLSGNRTIHPLFDYFTGYLDEVILFDRALTDEEISALHRLKSRGSECAEDADCDDGLFCNGNETCRTGLCMDEADPCVDPAHCDEADDVCFECVDNAECDDANDCTTDECISDACVNTPVADDTPCPDGIFCNGVETCQAGACTDQADPCIDEAHCDEDADVCIDCIRLGDGDSDGVVGPLDFALMFDCRTAPVGPIDPPAYEEGCVCFDFNEDGDVDLEDHAAFQTVFERVSIATVQLVALITSGAEDEVSELPVGDEEFPLGDSFFIEIWAQINESDGLASVYLDMLFDPAVLNAEAITHTVLFNLFQLGTIDNETGLIREVGGSHLGARGCENPVGVAPGWARVAVIEMRAEAAGASTVASADTGSPFTISICGSFQQPVTDYRDVEVTIIDPYSARAHLI